MANAAGGRLIVMLNFGYQAKCENHPSFFDSVSKHMSLMHPQCFVTHAVMVYRQKFLQYTGEAIIALNQYLRGWIGYFGFCQTSSVLRDLDSWVRHRLRCLQWKQWKTFRRRRAELIKRGIKPELAHTTAFSSKRPWRGSDTPGVRMALDNRFFDRMGLIRLRPHQRI